MADKLYIGNLHHQLKESQVRDHFSQVGEVQTVHIISDKKGRSRCFGFVWMENGEEAIANLNNTELLDRKIRISKAFQAPQRSYHGGHGGYRGRRSYR